VLRYQSAPIPKCSDIKVLRYQSAPIPNRSDGDLSAIRSKNKRINTVSSSFYMFSRNTAYGNLQSDQIVIKYSIVSLASDIVHPEKYVSALRVRRV